MDTQTQAQLDELRNAVVAAALSQQRVMATLLSLLVERGVLGPLDLARIIREETTLIEAHRFRDDGSGPRLAAFALDRLAAQLTGSFPTLGQALGYAPSWLQQTEGEDYPHPIFPNRPADED